MKHQYLLELGGENTELGKIEALELLLTENYEPELTLDENSIIIISVSNIIESKIIRRLGMTKRISKIFHEDEKTQVEDVVRRMPMIDIEQKTFAIRQICNKRISEKKNRQSIG